MESGRWLVPFKGYNSSGAYDLNFLWQRENLYVMDNHRAALWCWFQHLRRDTEHPLLHIDRHTDTLRPRVGAWRSLVPDLWNIGLDEYLACPNERGSQLFSWGNYLSIFLTFHEDLVKECALSVHEGDLPCFQSTTYKDPWDLCENLEWLLTEYDRDWIVNIDLDYFFCKDSSSEAYIQLMSDTYIRALARAVGAALDRKTARVVTIALSPEQCGGWENAEAIATLFLDPLGVQFSLRLQEQGGGSGAGATTSTS